MSDRAQGIIQLIVVCIFIGLSVFASFLLQSTQEGPQRTETNARELYVETENISPAPYRISFETTGTVQARAEIGVVPEVPGRVVEVNPNFFEGGTFEAGEVLFKIEPKDFKLEIERLEAAVAQARTAFNIAEAESEASIEEWRSLNGDAKPPRLVAKKPQLDEAWANLKGAKAQLENAKLDLERSTFSLPFAGRVLSASLEEGQYVSAGQEYGRVFDLASLEVRASLEDKQLEWLMSSNNPDIDITANYLGEQRKYDGVMKRAASALDPQTRFAAVNFGFVDKTPDLLPGIFATINVTGQPMDNISQIPASALQKEGIVWVVDDNKTLRAVEPDVIFATQDHLAARNFGSNMTVVTSRVAGATEGMSVTLSDDNDMSDEELESDLEENAQDPRDDTLTNGG